jgi:hypothetical protein
VVESTYSWYWLVEGLIEAGYQLHLENTEAIRQYSGLKHTDDQSDARWLAPIRFDPRFFIGSTCKVRFFLG